MGYIDDFFHLLACDSQLVLTKGKSYVTLQIENLYF